MKKSSVSILTLAIFLLLLQSFVQELPQEKVFPEEVSAILKTSCYDCHTTGARSADALKAVDFLIWDEYSATKKISVLGEICKMVEEGKMPPQKYLENKPESQMSEAQKKIVCDWTKAESDKLMQVN
jgi:peptide subunit release factor 1 (eRF1)